MATKYWIGGTGTWDNTGDTHWSTSSGGSNDTTHPTSGDAVILDANSGGGTVTLGADINVTSITMGAFTGTLDFGATNPTMATFSGTGTGTRTLNMGSGTWTITGSNATVWTTLTTTNLTLTGTGTINFTYAGATGTRAIQNSTPIVLPNIKISAGTDIVNLSSNNTNYFNDLDFTGFTGIWSAGNHNCSGNLILGTGMTVAASGSNTITMSATSGIKTITSNGVAFNRLITFDGIGGTWKLNDDLNMVGANSDTLTLTNGTFNDNNKNVSVAKFASSNSNTRTLTKGTGTWTLTGTGTVWNTATTTGLTFTDSGTTKITDTSNTANTFSGGGLTFNDVWFSRGASTASNTIVGNNTFRTFRTGGSAAHSFLFTTGSTQYIGTFGVSGTAGNLVTINSTDTGVHNLVATGSGISRDYLSIQHSVATPANYWYAGTHSTDNQAVATAGSGWVFTDIPAGYGIKNKIKLSNSISINI